ncbi:hypothetical protein [Sphingomonas hankyongi]|uniref:Lipoprotein n=1 Tax=Sphingomonas hankyongi TaxID=2908209 RepID=A0ABT0S4U9_9SPHN|nr:hypothetical protein [Sphingomonas hankyongi]MCL6730884.1 hypothetical protein [Sphingomonas hankyongi]
MKSRVLKALPLVALFALLGCETDPYGPTLLEKQYYAGCATSPPENPACGHH